MVLALSISILLSYTTVDASVKIKYIKKKTEYSTYKAYKDKVKYAKRIKITWKKLKKASGYQVAIYRPATKKWEIVKKTQSTRYFMTSMLSKDRIKIRLRAYFNESGMITYSNWSKPLKFKNKSVVCKRSKKGKPKAFYDKIAAQEAFVLQNQMRNKVEADSLDWSEMCYDIAKQRAQDIVTEFSHDKFKSTSLAVLNKKYGIQTLSTSVVEDGFNVELELVGGENIACNQSDYIQVMDSWKKSPGHYMNLKAKCYKSGAIAVYQYKGIERWVSVFSEIDNLDDYIK